MPGKDFLGGEKISFHGGSKFKFDLPSIIRCSPLPCTSVFSFSIMYSLLLKPTSHSCSYLPNKYWITEDSSYIFEQEQRIKVHARGVWRLDSGVSCLQVWVVLPHAVHCQRHRREASHALLGRKRGEGRGEGGGGGGRGGGGGGAGVEVL